MLSDLPNAIAQTRTQLLSQERHVRTLQDALSQFNAEIESSIAFDDSLKNDAQRKARKGELIASAAYQARLSDLQDAQDKRTDLDIQLELLRNQFSVQKLERRETIAQMELASAA